MLPFLQRYAFRRFRQGGAGPWGALFAAVFGLRTLRRWAARNEEVVYREVLRPGEQVVVSHRPESRQALARSEQKALKAHDKAVKAERKAVKAGRRAGRRRTGEPSADQ